MKIYELPNRIADFMSEIYKELIEAEADVYDLFLIEATSKAFERSVIQAVSRIQQEKRYV